MSCNRNAKLTISKKSKKKILTSRFLVYSMVQPCCNQVLTAFCNKNARFKKSVLIYHYVPFQSRYVYTYINCNILRDLPPFKRKLQDMVFFSGICAKKCPRQYSKQQLKLLQYYTCEKKKNLIKMQPILNWHWHKNACV